MPNDIEFFFNHRQDNTLLSKRESDAIRLLVEGWGNETIAKKLGIGIRTLEKHLINIYEKLEARGIDFKGKHKRVYTAILYLNHNIQKKKP